MERSADSPLQLESPRAPLVRLNRRVLYVLGAALIGVVVVGLVALRAQGPRAATDPAPARVAGAPAGDRWFDKVPDRAPERVAALDPPPAQRPVTPATPTTPRAPTAAELEAQRQERALRAALSAPIGVTAFDSRALPSRPTAPGVVVPSATLEAAKAGAGQAPAAGDSKLAGLPPDTLRASVRGPVSPYEVKAGTIIPGVMISGINSDLPGQITAQARENVFDTETGEYLLIPQGTRLIGLYDHHVVVGQERVLISWKRLIFPNGTSLSLRDGMPGTDPLGAAGFTDEVNNHFVRVFGQALLLSVISAGVQLSQIPSYGQNFQGPTAGNVLGAAVGQQLGSTSAELIRRGMTIAPTLEIRPGYSFNIMVTQDLVFPGPYDDARHP